MPFKVKDLEFINRTFANIKEYEQAKISLAERQSNRNLKHIYLNKAPEEILIEAELKSVSRWHDRIVGVETELRRFRGKVEDMLSEILVSVKILLINKDGIPYMTRLEGTSTVKGEFPNGKSFELLVTTQGYETNGQCYSSLSAAAEGVSGNRRNGWEWWKTKDGRTVKDVFKASQVYP